MHREQMGEQIREQIGEQMESHAELAMKAAKSVARARRKGQKEKIGHVVCHHLLCLLNAADQRAADQAAAPKAPRRGRLQAIREIDTSNERQISLGF